MHLDGSDAFKGDIRAFKETLRSHLSTLFTQATQAQNPRIQIEERRTIWRSGVSTRFLVGIHEGDGRWFKSAILGVNSYIPEACWYDSIVVCRFIETLYRWIKYKRYIAGLNMDCD